MKVFTILKVKENVQRIACTWILRNEKVWIVEKEVWQWTMRWESDREGSKDISQIEKHQLVDFYFSIHCCYLIF